jgi:hypothetical protein
MSKGLNTRSVVAFVAGVVLLAGVAGPVVGQTALTWPITIDVSGLERVAVVIENTSPVAVNGVLASLLNLSGSSLGLGSVYVCRIEFSGTVGSSYFYNSGGWLPVSIAASSSNAGDAIAPGAAFVVLVVFTGMAADGTRLVITPELYSSGYFWPIVFSGGR